MKHTIFKESSNTEYTIGILVKESSFDYDSIKRYYVDPITNKGIKEEDIIALSLAYNDNNKAPVKFIKEKLNNILKACTKLNIKTLLVTDANYFKVLTGLSKAENYYGSVCECKITGYESIKIIITINYKMLFYNPTLKDRLDMGLNTLISEHNGSFNIKPNIIKTAYMPKTELDISVELTRLKWFKKLTCDVETRGLKFYNCGIASIAFAWNQHEGLAFQVDTDTLNKNEPIRLLLKKFFTEYSGKLVFHNAGFDITVLIYQLWMDDITDIRGMYEGLDIMTRNFECTQIITYLATNSCAGNKLSLKYNAHEFAGNYAIEDINDITKIDTNKLLEYNLIDCLCTWFVLNKYYPKLIQDNQKELYTGLMKDSLITIIQMQLTGMPICLERVLEVEIELKKLVEGYTAILDQSSRIDDALYLIKNRFLDKDFNDRKGKAKNPDKIKPKVLNQINIEFNPNSSAHIACLLHEIINLPIIETTPTKLPATDEKTLKSLLNHTTDNSEKELINAILGIGKVNKILNTFIPAFKEAQLGNDGNYYLFGSYKLGGTISSRLSSNSPNLQQIPSGSTYGKLIKSCFRSNKDWVFCGADFASLEDRINALLTKDPNKLKIYLDGFDGHSLRAYSYFSQHMPDIDPDKVDSINSIGSKYKDFRQASKAPTFALTYGGTFHTLIKNCGFSEEQAKEIETKYHELYKVSDQWVNDKLKQASIDGYVTLAFGLRLRTPILKQVLWDTPKMPYEASAEGRSAGNAVSGQSWGLLTCRAANELRKRIRNSPFRYKIKISAQIHDAIYSMAHPDIDTIYWLNNNFIECMEWQNHPEIQHDEVKLGAELDLFYPAWHNAITIPNKASKEEIIKLCKEE